MEIQTDSLEKIKEFILANGVPINSKWLDYTSLNAALECKRTDVAKFMLEKNFRVNRTGKSASHLNTPLHHAVKMEDLELVNSLLIKKASIVALNDEGDTPLHLAFMSRNNPAVDSILNSIKNSTRIANPKNKKGLSHFHIACIRNNDTVVRYFLKSRVNVEDAIYEDSLLWPGCTALHLAVEYKCFKVVKLLLDAGADKYAQNTNEMKPFDIAEKNFADVSMMHYYLADEHHNYGPYNKISNFHVACMKSNNNLVESFINSGAAINNRVSRNSVFCPSYTPLHFAVESNKIENVQLLVNHGSDLDLKNGYYMTPLHLALYNEDHKEKDTIVDFLYSLVEEKNKDCTDLNGLTYFHIACTRNDTETVKKFLERGEDVNGQILYNLKNFSHYTPLHFAVRYNCVETAELLIKHGANINRSDNGMHGTPLHLAFDNGSNKMVELLMDNGADVNAIRPYDDKNMLHIFVEQLMDRDWRLDDPIKIFNVLDRIESDVKKYVVKLVKAGCNVNAQDSDGNTALHIACSKLINGMDIAVTLLKYGADINIENNEGDTPFRCTFHDIYRNNFDDYMTFYHHVQKLKDLGLRVNPKNEKCCKQLFKDKDEHAPGASCFLEENINKKRQQRLEEIDRMKKVKIDRSTSLYQILFEDGKKLSLLCKNNDTKKIMEQKDFYKLYPSYGDMLQLQYQKGLGNLGSALIAVEVVAEPRAKRKRR